MSTGVKSSSLGVYLKRSVPGMVSVLVLTSASATEHGTEINVKYRAAKPRNIHFLNAVEMAIVLNQAIRANATRDILGLTARTSLVEKKAKWGLFAPVKVNVLAMVNANAS